MKKIKYYISFNSYENFLLTSNILTIILEIKRKLNYFKIEKFIRFPITKKRVTVNRSPFVDNVSKEHFELCTYKVLIILELNLSFSNNKEIIYIVQKLFEKYILNILKYQDVTINIKKKIT